MLNLEDEARLAKMFIPMAYARIRNMKDANDYLGPAMFGIFYALRNRPSEISQESLSSWISTCINRFIYEASQRKSLIPVPRSTRYDAEKKGVEVVELKRHKLSDSFSKSNSRFYDEIVDTLDDISNNEIDEKIIKMRIEGYVDEEIAKSLGISFQAVHKRRINIKKRFYEKLFGD